MKEKIKYVAYFLLGSGVLFILYLLYRQYSELKNPVNAPLTSNNPAPRGDGGKVKGAYAKADETPIYDQHFVAQSKAKKDHWLGTIKDEFPGNSSFWLLDDGTLVAKVSVYIVS